MKHFAMPPSGPSGVPIILLLLLGCPSAPIMEASAVHATEVETGAVGTAPGLPESPPDIVAPREPLAIPAPGWTIVGLSESYRLPARCSAAGAGEVSEYWQARDPDVAAVEKALEQALASLRDQSGALYSIPVGTYLRQYAGAVVNGRRVILVAGSSGIVLRRHSDAQKRVPDWTEYVPSVCDGGDTIFDGVFDLSLRRFVNLEFSGPAFSCCDSNGCAAEIRCVCVDRSEVDAADVSRLPKTICEEQWNRKLPLKKQQ